MSAPNATNFDPRRTRREDGDMGQTIPPESRGVESVRHKRFFGRASGRYGASGRYAAVEWFETPSKAGAAISNLVSWRPRCVWTRQPNAAAATTSAATSPHHIPSAP